MGSQSTMGLDYGSNISVQAINEQNSIIFSTIMSPYLPQV